MKLKPYIQFKLDKLKYNSGPTEKHQEYINEGTPLLSISPDDIPVKLPFANSDNKVKTELQQVRAFQSTSKAEGLAEEWDTGFLNKMEDVIVDAGYKYDSKYFNSLADTLRNLVLILKYKYNRPRPSQLADYHDVKIKEFETHTAKTPSYPSGHSLMAMGVVLAAGEIYRDIELTGKLKQMAQDVADSRIAGGLHYPSDNAYSFEIARYINKFITK